MSTDDKQFFNQNRKQLQHELTMMSLNTHQSMGHEQYQFNMIARDLHKALAEKHDVTQQMAKFRVAYEDMHGSKSTSHTMSGLANNSPQNYGVDRQRMNLFNLMDKVHQDIRDYNVTHKKTDINH